MKKKLKEICEVKQSKTTSLDDDKVWILNLDKIESHTGKILEYEYSKRTELGQSICQFDENTVLYSKLRPYLNKVVLPTEKGFATSELVPLVPKENITRKYLAAFLRSNHFVSLITDKVAGTKMPRVVMKDFFEVEIPVPTLSEQQKIAAHLDTIQSAIDNKKQQLALLDEAVKSKFVEMFGEGSCKQIPFSEYAEIIDGDRGKNYPKSEDFSDDDYCLFLSAKNVTKNGFLFENNQFISKEKDEILRKGKLNRGDIVITTRGTIGNIAYFDDSIPYENIRINSGMVIIRNKDLEFNQRFFLEAFRNKIDEIIATQVTGAAQPQLPIHIMSKITLPYPDLPLQNKFSAFVQQIDKSKSLVKQQIADLQELLDSRMQEYFA